MNILELIQKAITELNSDATVNIFTPARDENAALDYSVAAVVIYPNWFGNNKISRGDEIYQNVNYEIDFKVQDEFDTSDSDSAILYENMLTLANSVFFNIHSSFNEYIRDEMTWNFKPIWRENNGTMTGVKVKLTIPERGKKVCNYE